MFILNYLIKERLKFLSIGGVIVFEKKIVKSHRALSFYDREIDMA